MTWNEGRLLRLSLSLSPIEEEGDIEEPGALMGDADAESREEKEGSQHEGYGMCPLIGDSEQKIPGGRACRATRRAHP
jgi:hypothetical protein